MKRLIIIISFLSFGLVISQNPADYWFFGENMGLKFNPSGKPTPITGSLNTLEGCAAISDNNGKLIFYSDGSNVWSRDHRLMPNGTDLLGDESSTQSALIVPNPKNSNIYYLFTVGSTLNTTGYHYYTVDLTLNNGMGDIVGDATDLSGTQDGSVWSEKITSVETDSCDSFWVISLVDNFYFSYRVDENGVNATPVISKVDFTSDQSRGYLKISPDGKKLAVAHQGLNSSTSGMILYSFDNSTGVVSNDGQRLYNSGGVEAPYGIEFSSSGDMLYMSTIDVETYRLYQFDLLDDDLSTRRTLIHKEEGYRGALQLGPDLKIYVTIPEEYTIGTHFLDVIHFPELKGQACEFETDYINFGNGQVMQGLPPFIQSFFVIDDINIVNPYEPISETSSNLLVCQNSTYTLQGPNIEGAEYFWSYSDGSTTIPISTPSPPHKLIINEDGANTEGIYSLYVDSHDDCENKYEGVAEVQFTFPPNIEEEVSLINCDLFDNNSSDGLTLFDLRQSNDLITNNSSSDYNIFFYLDEGSANTDHFNINALPFLYSNIIPNQKITAKVYEKGSSCYSLSEVELIATPSLDINSLEFYGCDQGDNLATFNLNEVKSQIINTFGNSNDYTVYLYDSIDSALNENQLNGNKITSSETLIFFKVEKNDTCFGSGQIELKISTFPEFDVQETIIICDNSFPIELEIPISQSNLEEYTYHWSTGDTTTSISVDVEQTVKLKIIEKISSCEIEKTFKILSNTKPILKDIDISIGEENNITINTASNTKNLYALNNIDDNFDYFYQQENVFESIPPGTYDLYVQNDCGTIIERIFVFGFQKFITPNNDGYHDEWKVKGLDYKNFTYSDVTIFDRYGKLINRMSSDSSWNGLYNGKLLPSSDYWFTISVTNNNFNTLKYTGHFSILY